jgi:hypothetical protein
MMSQSPMNPERRYGPVEPGFAELPLPVSAGAAADPVESGALAVLRGSSGQGGAEARERLPPGRSTRPGEH